MTTKFTVEEIIEAARYAWFDVGLGYTRSYYARIEYPNDDGSRSLSLGRGKFDEYGDTSADRLPSGICCCFIGAAYIGLAPDKRPNTPGELHIGDVHDTFTIGSILIASDEAGSKEAAFKRCAEILLRARERRDAQ